MKKKGSPGCKPGKRHCGPSNFLLVLLICVGMCVGASWVVNAAPLTPNSVRPVTKLTVTSAIPENPASTYLVAGQQGLYVGAWKLTASNVQDIEVSKLKIREMMNDFVTRAGAVHYLVNFKLLVDGQQVGTTQLQLTVSGGSRYVTFTGAPTLFTVPKNSSKIVILTADAQTHELLSSGTNGIDYKFRLTNSATNNNNADITAKGTNTNTYVLGVRGANSDSKSHKWVKSKPSFARNMASPSGSASPGVGREVFRFDISNTSSEDVAFISGESNLRFTIHGTGRGNCGGGGCAFRLYDRDGLAMSEEVKVNIAENATINFTRLGFDEQYAGLGTSFIIPSGETRTYSLRGDLSDMRVNQVLQFEIKNGAADMSWNDMSPEADISGAGFINLGLPIYSGSLVF